MLNTCVCVTWLSECKPLIYVIWLSKCKTILYVMGLPMRNITEKSLHFYCSGLHQNVYISLNSLLLRISMSHSHYSCIVHGNNGFIMKLSALPSHELWNNQDGRQIVKPIGDSHCQADARE